jgi:hypothetical protein
MGDSAIGFRKRSSACALLSKAVEFGIRAGVRTSRNVAKRANEKRRPRRSCFVNRSRRATIRPSADRIGTHAAALA